MRRLFCTLALSLMASPVFADPPAANVSPGAVGRELIARANADGVFELAATDAQTIVLRHSRSGLTCRMHAASANRLLIFPQAARGEDVKTITGWLYEASARGVATSPGYGRTGRRLTAYGQRVLREAAGQGTGTARRRPGRTQGKARSFTRRRRRHQR